MPNDNEYEPTTEVVRDEWVHLEGAIPPDGIPKREAAFDRWLAEHDRQVAAKAWDEGYHYVAFGGKELTDNPYEGTPEQEEER